MNKFIYKSLCFFGIIFIAILGINLSEKKNEKLSNYTAAIIYKHSRIEKIKSPKLILAGGSNLAFGIDSGKLEKEFSIPVVNLGLHASLGLSFMLEELKHSIKVGDVVLLSPEYFLEKNGDYRLKKKTSNFYKEAELYYSSNLFDDFNIYLENTNVKYKGLFKKVEIENKSTEIKVYSREAFNKYGDVIAHLDKVNSKELSGKEYFEYRYWEGIDQINEFDNYAKKKNVKVYYLFPDFLKSEYVNNRKAITQLESDLKNNLTIPILNKPTDFLFTDGFFYDTVYHLNKKGRNERTNKLIVILKNNKIIF
ncbi:MAG: hypothetical protein ABI549_11050 [Flavobacterium sp.]|uniref:hypothetical protein n=1 Tax=Flavobacterium sp. TaxID=239 RepID=UPI00326758A3